MGVVERAVAAAEARRAWRSRAGRRRGRARPRPRSSAPGPGRRRSPRRACSRCRGCGGWRCAGSSTRGAPAAVTSTSCTVSPARCPPLTSTARQPSASSALAASRIAAISPIVRAAQDFGFRQVRRQHRGARHQQPLQRIDRVGLDQRRAALGDHHRIDARADIRRRARRAPRRSSRSPRASCSMPVLIASAPMSSSTTSICWRIKSGGIGRTPNTPSVFCAVSAVIAVAA